jgi:hypothetical protein
MLLAGLRQHGSHVAGGRHCVKKLAGQ